MIADGFDPRLWVAASVCLAIVLGTVRLLLWQKSAPADGRSPRPRMALLLGLTAVAGLLLYLSLFPPSGTGRSGALIVATGGTPSPVDRGPGDIVVALPEAAHVPGAIRVPDLSTALRRFPGVASIRIEGQGLVPRDQLTLETPLAFDPPPAPRGLIDLALPGPIAPGAVFSVGGQIGALPVGVIELIDPAGGVVDRERVVAGARFVVTADTRTAGLALFGLRLRDAAGGVVEQIAVPVHTRAQAQPRVRVLAGAPGPETKYLRRWAEDANIDLAIDIDVGGGVQLGDAPVSLTRAALGEVDVLVIDDRRWETLGAGNRAAVAAAVADGLGLLLRPTGPLSPATRRDWADLGLPLTGTDDNLGLRLDPPPPTETGSVPQSDPPVDALPHLTRRDLADEGTGAVSLLRDAEGIAWASWRARGRGRIGVWTLTDSYALVLTGRADRYADLWSDLFSALARAGDDSLAHINGQARAGTRVAVCRVIGQATILDPDGGQNSLVIDPRTGDQSCAAYWPARVGWHVVRDGQGRETLFYAHPANAAPSLVAWANRQATLALVPSDPSNIPAGRLPVPGSSWPWFGALVAVLALLWSLERNRVWPTDSRDD